MDLINKLDLFTMDTVEEAFLKKVIRKGKLKRKIVCPVGVMKAKDGKCVMMSPSERKARDKAAKKRGKMLKANKGIQFKANKKRAKSMKKRAMQIPDQGAASLKEEYKMTEYLIEKYLGEAETTFSKANFMKMIKSGKGIVVYGTGGGYSDTKEFGLTVDQIKKATEKGKIDMLFKNADMAVKGAKDPKMKGRKFMVRID